MPSANYKHYAKAYIEAIVTSDWQKEISGLREAIRYIAEVREMKNFLQNRNIDVFDKKEVLKKVFGKKLNKNSLNLLLLLVDDNLLNDLPKLVDCAENELMFRDKVEKVEVISVLELNKKQLKELTEVLNNKLKKQVVIENVLDEEIGGGLKIRMGDTVLDLTVSGRIQRLKNNLYK